MAKEKKIPFPFTPALNTAGQDMERLAISDRFLQAFKTPEDIDQHKNYILHSQFEDLGIESPFVVTDVDEQTGIGKATFNPEAREDTSEYAKPEQQAFRDIKNRLIKFGGKLPEPDFMDRVVGNSMTAGWINLLTGEDISGMYKDFGVVSDGFTYKGKKLNLSPEESKTISDYINRNTGADADLEFWDKIAQTAGSLAFDLPLMYITGGVVSGAMKLSTVTNALTKSTNFLPRLLGQTVQQSVNFNLLGLPQTVSAFKDTGFDGALDNIWHSAQMGTLAATTGTLGTKIFKPIPLEVMKRNPALVEELGGLSGSFGFGYLSSKLGGESTTDAIATGLAFSAVHFTNPLAYRRVIAEQKTKGIRIWNEKWDGTGDPTQFQPDYFVEKNNTLVQINKNLFKKEGKIIELGTEPIPITDNIRKSMIYYNQIPDHYNMTYSRALSEIRIKKNGAKLYEQWIKELPSDYVKQNAEQLRSLAEFTAASIVGEKLSKSFAKWKLPEEKNFINSAVKLVNDFNFTYADVKKFVISNIGDYVKDPEGFIQRLEVFANEKYGEQGNRIFKALEDVVAKTSDAKNKEFITTVNKLTGQTKIADVKLPKKEEKKTEQKKEIEIPDEEIYTREDLETLEANELQKIAKNLGVDVGKIETPEEKSSAISVILDTQPKEVKPRTDTKVENLENQKIEEPSKTSIEAGSEQNVEKVSKDIPEPTKTQPALPKEEIFKPLTSGDTQNVTDLLEGLKVSGDKGWFTDTGEIKPEIKQPLDKLVAEAKQTSDAINAELAKNPENLKKNGGLKSSVEVLPEHVLAAKLDKYMKDAEIAAILNIVGGEKFRGYTSKNVSDLFRKGRLKGYRRFKQTGQTGLTETEVKTTDIKEGKLPEGTQIIQAADLKPAEELQPGSKKVSELTREEAIEYAKIDDMVQMRADTKGMNEQDAINDLLGEGKITQEQADFYESVSLFNEAKPQSLKPATPEQQTEFVKQIKDKFGGNVDVEFGEIAQEPGSPTVRTAMTYSKDGKVRIRISELAGKEAFNEEEFHASMLLASKPQQVEWMLKRYSKWDGTEADFTRAHEDLYRRYAAWQQGYMPKLRGFDNLRDKWNALKNIFKNRGYVTESRFFEKYAKGEMKFAESLNEKYYRSLFNKMTTIPGKLRDAFDKDVVRYGIKTFEIIKDNETIIVNDALWARLKNAGVKDSELGYIKWIIQSELPGRFNNKISGHIFKMRIAEYLFPIKINRLRNTAFESMTIMGRNKGEGTNYGVWSFDLPFNVKQVHNYWDNNQSLGWMRGYEETRATTKEEQSTGIAEQVKTGVFNVNEIQSQLQYTKAPKWEDLKVGDKVKLNGREYIIEKKWDSGIKFDRDYGEYGGDRVTRQEYEKEKDRIGDQPEFLRSLQPHWEQMMMRSIIQWASDNGYHKVRFPTGETIKTIEGFDRLEQEIGKARKDMSDIQKELDIINKTDKLPDDWIIHESTTDEGIYFPNSITFDPDRMKRVRVQSKGQSTPERAKQVVIDELQKSLASVLQHEKDLQQALESSAGGVIKFYEENVGKYGRKLRGSDNWKKVKDQYGNEWWETNLHWDDSSVMRLYNEVRRESLDPNRVVDAERSFDEYDALGSWARKNAFDAKDIMDWYNKSRLVNVEARSRAAWGKVKNFFINTLPPAPIADKYIKFRGLRNIGEVEIIREIPAIRARIIREHFKDGKPFKKLSKSDKDGLMAALEKYEYDIRDGNTEELNLNDLVKKYNLNPKQKEILELYQNTTRAFVDKARQFWGQYLFENEKNIAGYLGKRDFAKLFPEAVERTGRVITPNIAVANEIMSKNPALKIQAIDIITKKMYDYGDKFYLDSVRPTAPNYTIFRMEKITDNKNHEQQADGTYKDYVEGYGRNQKELNEQIDKWKSQGYELKEAYELKDLIRGGQFDKLTERQLMNLAEQGHIELTEPVLQRLRDAIKSGNFNQHTIKKRHIRGLHFTPEEFESNLHRFGDEVLAAKRQNAIIKMNKYMSEWKTSIDEQLKSADVGEGQKADILREYDYATKYINNITHSDRSFIDGYKSWVGVTYTAWKGAFFTQQMLQGLQTTWHLARGKYKQAGQSYSAGDRAFFEGSSDAIKLLNYIRTLRYNEKNNLKEPSPESFGLNKEIIDLYQIAADSNKLGKVGIEELTGSKSDIEYQYMEGLMKPLEAFKRFINIPSAAIEKYTRLQAFMTFYKLGKINGLTGDKLANDIMDNIDLSMSQWGVGGRSPLLASKISGKRQEPLLKAIDKMFFTFKTFSTHNLGLYENLYRNKLWGALATKAFVGIGLHGLTKFPLMATMFAVANLFTDDDVEYESLQLLDSLDGVVPGVGTVLGRGFPYFAGIDMRNLFDEQAIYDAYAETRSRSAEGKIAEVMLGAPYGLFKDVLDQADALYKHTKDLVADDVTLTAQERKRVNKNLTAIAPLFLRNILSSMTLADDGVEVRGKTILKNDDLSTYDIIMKALSFNPVTVSKAYEEQFSGFPAKWARINGRITELRKIRGEIKKSDDYSAKEKSNELKHLAELLRESIAERSRMMKQPAYRESIKQGTIR